MGRDTKPAYVLGVGMTKFVKPRGVVDYPEMGFEAGVKALFDAHITYDDVDQGVACYCYGDSTCGQRVFYQFGMTNIPIYNVNNNCSTGSTGLHMARTMVSHGVADCVLVIGFEKMARGSLGSTFKDRADPMGTTIDMIKATKGPSNSPIATQIFGNAGKEYEERYGAKPEDFARIAQVNHEHSQRNPYSQFQDVYTIGEIMNSGKVHASLTKLQCCPTSDGSAAAVVVSQAFLDARPELKDQAILIAGQCMATDSPGLFSGSSIGLVGYDMTAYASRVALKEADVNIEDVRLVELHDCFSTNEMITIDGLGLCKPGKAHEMVRNGDITYGGKVVINPSGGLISKGHPLGATGLAQCAELVWQLRGWANNRLVEGSSSALQHNLGLGGAVVVTVYKRADGAQNKHVSSEIVAKLSGTGYNPAVKASGISHDQVRAVTSKKASSEWAMAGVEKKIQPSL